MILLGCLYLLCETYFIIEINNLLAFDKFKIFVSQCSTYLLSTSVPILMIQNFIVYLMIIVKIISVFTEFLFTLRKLFREKKSTESEQALYLFSRQSVQY